MKRLFPLLLAIALFATACQLGGGAKPTPIALPTANPDDEAANSGGKGSKERTSSVDGMVQVLIPAGSFQMGGVDSKAASDEIPPHRVTMIEFWMDKVEVTNGMYLLCVNAGACRLPFAMKSDSRDSYFNNPDYKNHPVTYVGWGEAQAYCEWAGRRLPTEAEWERAARGDDLRIYPWGDQQPDTSLANINGFVGDTAHVGSYPAGASPFGVLDLAGNVAEWVNDYYGPTFYTSEQAQNPTGPESRTAYFSRVVRGGTFLDSDHNVRVSKRSSVLGPNFNAKLDTKEYSGDYSPRIGFRCASD
jgi:serine/threonine-protein kinase